VFFSFNVLLQLIVLIALGIETHNVVILVITAIVAMEIVAIIKIKQKQGLAKLFACITYG
jgi:hypothetical protein